MLYYQLRSVRPLILLIQTKSCVATYLLSSTPQVFGVLDSPEYSGPTLGVTRPVIEDGREEHPVTHSTADLASATVLGLSMPKHSPDPEQAQVQLAQ